MCKTLRGAGRADGCASRRRRCAGRTNGRTDMRMSEWTGRNGRANRLRTIYSYSNACSLRSRERKRERVCASRFGVYSAGLRRGVASPLICSLYADCSFCIHGVSRFHAAPSLTFVGVSVNERHDSNALHVFRCV